MRLSEYEKPEWAQRTEFYDEAEHFAIQGQERAGRLRCAAEEGGGVRCTADAYPPHAHRYDPRDLPGHSS